MNHQVPEDPASSISCFATAAVLIYAGQWLRGDQSEFAAFFAMVLFVFSAALVLAGIKAWNDWRNRREIEESARTPSSIYGQSRWGTSLEAGAAGMLNGRGILLGKLSGEVLSYPGETHVTVMAPPGAGKGVSLVIPNLLSYTGSMIVNDPKGELFAVTGTYRKEVLGQRVIVLCPWAEKMSEELGLEIPRHGFNPLSIVRAGPDAKDDCELVSSLLLPGSPKMNASDEFWTDAGQSVITAFLLDLVSRYERVDLCMVRKRLLAAPDDLKESLIDISMNPDFGGAIAEYGGKLLATLANAPQQFEGGLGSAQKALRLYDAGSPLGQHVQNGEIDFRSIKESPTTIYLITPSDRIVTHAAHLNLVISLFIELIGRDRSSRRVLFLLDEFANLGFMPNILRGMAQYRSQGVQILAVIQQISQLERLYGKEGLREVLGMSELLCAFGIWEAETLRLLTELIGSQTVKSMSTSISPEIQGSKFSCSTSSSDVGVPLMRSDEIRTMPSNEMLLLYRNLPPFKAEKLNYLSDRYLRGRANPNPYHRR